MGRKVGPEGLELCEEHIKAVKEWPTPKSTKEVEQFLGLVNYHRMFLKDLTKLAFPL